MKKIEYDVSHYSFCEKLVNVENTYELCEELLKIEGKILHIITILPPHTDNHFWYKIYYEQKFKKGENKNGK